MSEEYPLYPELSEAGKLEAEALINRFKRRMKDVCEDILGEIYCDIPAYIESDAWTNFRNDMMDGFRDYRTRIKQGAYDFKEIRRQIYNDFRAEIIADLNQDHLEEIERQRAEISRLSEIISPRPHGCC